MKQKKTKNKMFLKFEIFNENQRLTRHIKYKMIDFLPLFLQMNYGN